MQEADRGLKKGMAIMPGKDQISMTVVRRLPRYYRFLYGLKRDGVVRISSRELAVHMGLTASQIRQDLNCFGGFGQQGYGYSVEQLHAEIGHILGVNDPSPAVIIGIGNMGRAIGNYMDFDDRGVHITALFDYSEEVVGQVIRGMMVQPMGTAADYCRENGTKIAILCIPTSSAPEIVTLLINAGVKAFWNFTGYDVAYHHPETVAENVHLNDSLMTLSYSLRKRETDEADAI